MKTFLKILMIAAPIAVLVVFGMMGSGVIAGLKAPPQKGEDTFQPLAVFAQPVEISSIALRVDTQGVVKPKREISVAPQISGKIAYVAPNFEEGGFIKAGQVLVRLEARDYELAKVRAESGVASAQQRLAREKAEAELALKDLEELGITDASPLARREPQLAEAEAALAAAKSQLADAELALTRTEVRAPFDGRVRELMANIGQYVGPGQSLGRIFASDVVEVTLPLSDAELGRLGVSIAYQESAAAPGPTVHFSSEVGGVMRHWTGRVTRTAAAVDPGTRLISAIAEVQDPYGKGSDNGTPMAPGLFVDASIEGRKIENIMRIPREALRGTDRVYVINPETETLTIRTVQVAYTDASGAYIASGLEPGELAVTSPMQSVFDGMKVSLAERGGNNTATASADQESATATEGVAQ